MRFVHSDFARLFIGFPYLQLNKRNVSLGLLRHHLRSLEVWGHYLPAYRTVRCEPLDYSYRWLTWLAVASDELCEDLFAWSWQGRAIAAWLTIMAPSQARREGLNQAVKSMIQPFSAELALKILDHNWPNDLEEHVELIGRIRAILESVPLPDISLRRYQPEPMREIKLEMERIYKNHGSDAAHAYLHRMASKTGLPLVEYTCPTRLTDVPLSRRQSWSWGITI